MFKSASLVVTVALAAFLAACNDSPPSPGSAAGSVAAAVGCSTEAELKAAFEQQMSATGSNARYEWRSLRLGPVGPRSGIDNRPSRLASASYRKISPAGEVMEDVSVHEMRFFVSDMGECRFDTVRYEYDWHPSQDAAPQAR